MTEDPGPMLRPGTAFMCRVLAYDDLEHYQRIVAALKAALHLTEEIDEMIPQWPIE